MAIDKTPLNVALAHATGKEPLIVSAECSVRLKPDDTGWVRVDVGSALAGTDVDPGAVARSLAGDLHLPAETLLDVVGASYRFEVRARFVFERDGQEIWMDRVPVRIEGNQLLLQTQLHQDQAWFKIEVVPPGNAAHQSAEACAAMVLARDRIAAALQVYPPRMP
jgi:hypothetical protein